ncbi:carbohydrate ABC transporter permease [Streptomyces sp. NPDC005263]|uniref:carbohydrate ABC transporter permease n=1 Tax=Streptomyces sp. NPDC005263 TaxID=3364711 RepID=UPI00369FB01E
MSSSPVAGPAPTGPTPGSDAGPTDRPTPDRPRGQGRHGRRVRPVSAGTSRGPGRRAVRYWPQYLAISPYYLLFSVFMLFPVLYTVYLAFQKWDGIGDMHFVGFQQFRFLWDDPVFWLSVRNTLVIWVLSTVPMLFLALVLAVLVNSTRRLTAFYRIALFIPSITSLVAIAIFFGAVFSNNFGLINAILRSVHVSAVPWMSNEWTIKLVIASLMTWQWTGYNAIIYLAGLQAIPSELYEAAKMDGARPVRIFFSITIPLLRPIILFTVVISTVTGLQSFTEPQVLFGSEAATNPNSGGPGQAGLTTLLYFYHQAFDNNDFGYGAAIVWAFFLVILLIVLINWRLVQRKDRRS